MKRYFLKAYQFLKFAFVGGINTGSSLLIYYFLLHFKVNYIIATICGYIGSSIIGYVLNSLWVFKADKTKITTSLLRYYIVYGSALVLNIICMYFWVQQFHINKTIAPFLTLCITVPYNYILSKLWVFKTLGKEDRESEK